MFSCQPVDLSNNFWSCFIFFAIGWWDLVGFCWYGSDMFLVWSKEGGSVIDVDTAA